jgi:hypothetical protein
MAGNRLTALLQRFLGGKPAPGAPVRKLSLPLPRPPCSDCKGTGQCPDCDGEGRHREGTHKGERCRDCRGDGDCSKCNGKGTL